ncbi:MAG: hypothetical protein J6Q75_04975 [Bacteroidaceae bacterium]|nr:hypothetical protein [Bacteroidaceae bacterium]
MNEDELTKIFDSIQEKVGKENSAAIADDLGTLITKNSETIQALKSKDTEIANLKSTNAKLVAANGNLLQQIPMSDEDPAGSRPEPEKEPAPFSMKACFDSRGNFIN